MNEDFVEGPFEGAWKTKKVKGDEDGCGKWVVGKVNLPAPTLEGLWWRIVEDVRRVKEMDRCLMVMRVDLGKGRLRSAGRDEGVMRMGMDPRESRQSEQTTWLLCCVWGGEEGGGWWKR